ncbi:hypothetical protein Bca52824_064675 [Brassica carinata]|nr:hypothetical protein Bca52824_064675 [Brassica carinata]
MVRSMQRSEVRGEEQEEGKTLDLDLWFGTHFPLPVQVFAFVDAVVLSVVGDQNLLVLHTVSGSDVTRIWVSNQVDEEAKDLSWNCDFVLAVDFHLSSLMNMESVRSEPNHPFDTLEHKLF